jgi:hypothetical protein
LDAQNNSNIQYQSLLSILAKCQSKSLGLNEQSVSNKDIMVLLNNVSKPNVNVMQSDSVKTLKVNNHQSSNPFI